MTHDLAIINWGYIPEIGKRGEIWVKDKNEIISLAKIVYSDKDTVLKYDIISSFELKLNK